jgi:phospholipase C
VPTTNEIYPGSSENPAGPYGLGVRVPMVVISPWSKGGWVNSEVFDHTSLIRFVERRFASEHPRLIERNITQWRRAVCGDLTSAFDFKTPNAAVVQLPSTIAYIPPDNSRHPDYIPAPPTDQSMPVQETGTRPARALPYELHVHDAVDYAKGAVDLLFHNTGRAAAFLQVRSGVANDGPWGYTVGAHDKVSDSFPVSAAGESGYDLSVYGPNGFFRSYKGSFTAKPAAELEVRAQYDTRDITLELRNAGKASCQVSVLNGYTQQTETLTLRAGEARSRQWRLDETHGWYDLLVEVEADAHFQRHIAGHLETGRDSVTDPAIGKASSN